MKSASTQYLFACAVILLLMPTVTTAAETVFETDESTGNPVAKLVLESAAGEGPAWHPDKGLFFSGHDGITLMNLSGTSSLFLPDAGSNGLLFDRQGRLLICQPMFRRVSRLDLTNGKLQVLTDAFDGMKYNQPNDITFDSKGRIYFSDPKYGERESMEMLDKSGRSVEGVYRIDADGTIKRIITHQVDRPNGVLVTADDRFLFVADNNNNQIAAARKLWRFDLLPDGTVDDASKKLIYDWKSGRGPDGMATDQQGRLYVAGGRNVANLPYETADQFKGGVYVFSSEGKLLEFVGIPRDEVTNCSFGGKDLRTLYITAGGTLWSIRTKSAGQSVWSKP